MKRLFLLLTFMLSFVQLRADEGMWLLMLVKRLNGVDMQKEGLHLTPEEIYSVNNSSLKDAIVSFGGFCTGEVISDQGLVLTNHHCGYGAVASASTPEKNYLKDGFWAMKKSEEFNAKGLYVRFLVRMGDATQRINSKLNNQMTEEQRQAVISAEYKAIEAENSENGKYTVITKDFFNGNEFYYFVYQDYKDIRLVGAPPASLGKYGGDTDNWEWPRHTADFTMFRIYADAKGNPAEYSVNNVPFTPKHSLPISLKGYKPGDFAMILGYPGRTNRYMTSYGIDQLVNKDYPAWVESSKMAMDIMKKYMDKDEGIRLNYASQYASVANYWKNRQGTIDSVIKNGTISDKKKIEEEFIKWSLLPENAAIYNDVLANIEGYYAQTSNRSVERNYSSQLQRNAKYVAIAYRLGSLFKSYADQTPENQAAMKPKIQAAINEYYEDFNPQLEGEMLNSLVNLYKTRVNPDVASKTIMNADATKLSLDAFASIFATKESAEAFLNNPDRLKIDGDKMFQFANSFVEDQKLLAERYIKVDENFQKNTRLFLAGLRKTFPDKKFYPDANSTMRLTSGKIATLPQRTDRKYYGVSEQDNFYTTAEGMIAKYVPGDEEFDLPKKVIDLVKKKDYGIYKDKKSGTLNINFLTDNDITGGNSGSPVIDGYGRLIGIAFDGNSEALSGDIVFEEKWQKTINVDIRYVLWIIDKYAGAKHLLSEMKFVK